jgi:hypothetical protein
MNPGDIRAPFWRKPWKRVKNSSGEAIPPYAVMRVVSSEVSDGSLLITVAKPNTTFLSEYLVNGPWAIGSGASDEGLATDLSESGLVLYGTGSPAVGEEWGPEPSTWTLKQYRYGFRIKGSTQAYGSNSCVVAQQIGVQTFLCKSNEEITADGDTGAISVYDSNQADITGVDISGAINRTGITFTNATWGKATAWGAKVYVEPWECP